MRFALLLVAGWFAGHALKRSPALTGLRYWVYRHQLQMQGGPAAYPRRTAVVMLDDSDYWGAGFAARSPLKRDELAKVLDRLREAGVNTVVLDVDLRSPDEAHPEFEYADYKAEDAVLLAAVRAMCHAGQTLVLTTPVRHVSGSEYVELPSIYTEPVAADPAAYGCVRKGYPQLPYDMRLVAGQVQVSQGQMRDSLSLAAIKVVNPIAYQAAVAHADAGFRYSRYLTEADYEPGGGPRFRYNGTDLKGTDVVTLRRDLADKVVLVGGGWHSFAKGQGPQVDLHDSPVGMMPGVFLHANYIEAMDGERGTFAPMSDTTVEVLEFSLAIVLAVIGVLEIHAGWKWGAFLLSCAISVVLTYVLLENLGIFLDFLIPLVILTGHTLVEEALELRHELQHLRRKARGGHA